MLPEIQPIVNAVALDAKFTVVAVVGNRSKDEVTLLMLPPSTATVPPTYTSCATYTPPATCTAPVAGPTALDVPVNCAFTVNNVSVSYRYLKLSSNAVAPGAV